MKRNNILVISLICLLCLSSCQSKTETPTASYDIELVEAKKLTLPVDEKVNPYSSSKKMKKNFCSSGTLKRNSMRY